MQYYKYLVSRIAIYTKHFQINLLLIVEKIENFLLLDIFWDTNFTFLEAIWIRAIEVLY